MIRVNLLPGAKRKSNAGLNMDIGAALASLTGSIDKFAVGAGAAVALSLAAMGVLFFTQHGRAQELAERERRAVQDSTRFAAVLRDRAQSEANRDAIIRQLAIIQSIDDRRYMWPHILEEVSRVLPPFTWLTQIIQTSAPPSAAAGSAEPEGPKGRGGGGSSKSAPSPAERAKREAARRDAAVTAARQPMRFRIVGNTVDIQALTRFMRDLEASPFIQNVQLARSDLVMVDQKEVTEFQLDAESEPADSTVVMLQPLSVEMR
jgi:Tfp pilus assembly protein PilN